MTTSQEQEDLVINEENEEWETVPSTNKTQGNKRFLPAVATRQSSRVLASHTTTQGGRAASIKKGNPITTPSFNSFEILNACVHKDLEHIAIQCDVSLGGINMKLVKYCLQCNWKR